MYCESSIFLVSGDRDEKNTVFSLEKERNVGHM